MPCFPQLCVFLFAVHTLFFFFNILLVYGCVKAVPRSYPFSLTIEVGFFFFFFFVLIFCVVKSTTDTD